MFFLLNIFPLNVFPFRNTKSLSSRQDEEETLWAENTRTLHHLQYLLANANTSGVYIPSSSSNLTPLHQVLICGTHVLPPLLRFWDTLHCRKKTSKPRRSGWRCLTRMAGRIPRKLCITKRATLASRRLKNLLPENTIGRPAVATNTYPLLEGLIDGFCNGIAYIYRLEGQLTCSRYQYLLLAGRTCR